ncbi:STAS domain-containing protein [Hymenobacter caeli]|uniref:MlaB-like STAS domain-containing protein n=1 Tax=Hymenobacter caeli TaxID=2735894 RepID=A0ABX2FNG3_9BACT|nr:STAS domain-containing protein [Hymenobacter caeli]NRT18551.1 hypothetical protein [Hymenobacter caeli]
MKPILTAHLGGHRGRMGLSLRGPCATPADADRLQRAVRHLLASQDPEAWVDCQGLDTLTDAGLQVLLRADGHARAAGTCLYWCGLTAPVLGQLAAAGQAAALQLAPIAAFRGPRFVLYEVPPGATPARSIP